MKHAAESPAICVQVGFAEPSAIITTRVSLRKPVCETCGETYVGATETACPFCGSTAVYEGLTESTIGAD